MEILIKSLLAGFLVAAIPWAVQTTIFKASIDKKTAWSLKFDLVATSMNALYMGFVYFGAIKLRLINSLLIRLRCWEQFTYFILVLMV